MYGMQAMDGFLQAFSMKKKTSFFNEADWYMLQ